jgi:hypothetical protein
MGSEDMGIWLVQSTELKVWKNKQDKPEIKMGQETFNQFGVAMNHIKYKGRYHG